MALDLLTYTVDTDDRGRLRASGVRFLGPVRPKHSAGPREYSGRSDVAVVAGVAACFLGVVALLAIVGVAPLWLLGLYGLLSAGLFAAYGADKSAAQHGRWRTSESSLHLLALAGGWPGALVAQRVFRHKTRKQPFQGIFWGTVIGNCLLLVVFLAASAAS
jgi:uncharacterized membrane protein YsdA (DUF1294 family)